MLKLRDINGKLVVENDGNIRENPSLNGRIYNALVEKMHENIIILLMRIVSETCLILL